jgi:hypothetical protein
MARAVHREHRFTRLLSTSSAGTALYGCSYGGSGLSGCPETEVRRIGQPSPFEIKRRERAARKRERAAQEGIV